MTIYHVAVARGSSGHAKQAAPCDARYVGTYYWCGYWRTWYKVISCADGWWEVQEVDLMGTPKGRVRKHCTNMEACHFADRPFKVLTRYSAGAIIG